MKGHESIATAANDHPAGLSAALKGEARRLGFDLAGIAPAVTPTRIHEFLDWLDRGYAGDMKYLERREVAYHHPQHVLDGARSVVMLGINYNPQQSEAKSKTNCDDSRREEARSAGDGLSWNHSPPGTIPARVARYAQGCADYHDVIRDKLGNLAAYLRREAPGCKARGIVDTAPLLERDFARAAGLGWFGKNTMLINKQIGSWFFLAGLLVDIELDYDVPHASSHCGTCTRCLDACPTQAFVEPYVLDARRCISYLTIEHRGPIPEELHAGMGDWLFGCDICQEVCPWNRKAPVTGEPAFQPQPELQFLDAAELLTLTDDEFRVRFGKTALARPGHAGLIRNAAVVLANKAEQNRLCANHESHE